MVSQKISHSTLLKQQIAEFLLLLRNANNKRSLPRPQKDYEYIQSFFHRVILDRNDRADVIDSLAYSQAVKIAKRLLPYPTSMEGCMDGRLFGPLVGLYGHIGETLPVAGGMFHEFVRGVDNQKLSLLKDSNFAELLRTYFSRSDNETILELIDSHLGCAARGGVETAKGKSPADNGLLADVLEKNEMKQAMTEYVNAYYQGKKTIIAMQISLDPTNGCMYMGLATHHALAYALQKGGYTTEVLDHLVAEGRIISTENFMAQPKVAAIFETHAFPIDISNQYGKVALGVWKAVDTMKESILPLIQEKLLKVHPQLKSTSKEKKLEIQERSILLLVNAFTGFLHKKYCTQYPFAQHNEEGISIAKGTTSPYKISLFGVSSLDMINVPSDLLLSTTLVRSNRKAGRVAERVEAPVGVVFQVKVMDKLSEADWQRLAKTDWQQILQQSWDTMSDKEFFGFLEEKNPRLPITVANAINKLRRRVAMLYSLHSGIAKQLLDQDSIILPVLSDTSYRIRCVIPFLKTGYN